jgi:hypothetical protein
MLAMLEFGRRLGIKWRADNPDGSTAGLGAVDGAVFGIMGLLLAFTFSGAASRLDARRQLIVQETNMIGTAYLRLDLLPASVQPELRQKFRDYVDTRLAYFRNITDNDARPKNAARFQQLQGEIWSRAVTGAKESGSPAVLSLVIASLNDVIDITTTRDVALLTHPPAVIYIMMALLMLTGSVLAGFGMAAVPRRSTVHMLGFALILAMTLYVILDLEFPRIGLVQISAVDQIMVDLRNTMK